MKRTIRVPEYLRRFFGDNPPEQVEVTIIDDEFLEEEAKRAAGEAANPSSAPASPAWPGQSKPRGVEVAGD
jgi:bifunctional DNA-binding transcriptional regulator/antitoxin component of YhaV-PrlF toxin-antitoxin module